ncbi:zinc ribbon domain-containing protein [Methylobacterium trifolii]|uniref:Putative zinc-ribbon domain-containing protein n=1 Tax=Methylobacterium trifolii TaxID=1003092 RepID=A0ABQ4TTW9_9HYPH|nr:zinc ribbon domain-containing protein [Methylobacterium trifolii]GJE58511.1 hypothetical protein MPOCJGCO_0593 [Methylobacterium trifolii]
MALVPCPACNHPVSEQARACPSCGHPGSGERGGVARVLGNVAGTYISATSFASLVLGVVMFTGFSAIMITLILSHR